MTAFIEWLEELAKKDSKVRAVLRRSLSFEPGTCIDTFPYVERFLKSDIGDWERKMYYLVAGLWAEHWREDRPSEKQSVAKACAEYMLMRKKLSDSSENSTEKRFILTIDSDESQLIYRLRQLVALLKEYPIDFSRLLEDLLKWKNKKIQITWAQDFYRSLDKNKNVTQQSMENIQ